MRERPTRKTEVLKNLDGSKSETTEGSKGVKKLNSRRKGRGKSEMIICHQAAKAFL